MEVKNINDLTNCLLNDHSYEERVEFDKSFDKNKIYNELINKEDLTPEETYLLGQLYYEGLGCSQSYSKAMEYYKKALDLGVKKAAEEIGSLYAHGRDVKEDIDIAKKYFEITAEEGYAFSIYNLGMIYLHGMGATHKDEAKGFSYFKKAADIGFRRAMDMVGKCYFNGLVVEKSVEESEKWFAKAYGDEWYFYV